CAECNDRVHHVLPCTVGGVRIGRRAGRPWGAVNDRIGRATADYGIRRDLGSKKRTRPWSERGGVCCRGIMLLQCRDRALKLLRIRYGWEDFAKRVVG